METTPAVVSQLTDQVTQILVPLLMSVALYLVHRAAQFFTAKTKIAISASQEEMIDGWISDGIRFAEEKAHQAAQKKDASITGHEKLEAAASFVLDMAKKNGLAEWTRDLLKAKIDAKINVVKERPGSPAGQ